MVKEEKARSKLKIAPSPKLLNIGEHSNTLLKKNSITPQSILRRSNSKMFSNAQEKSAQSIISIFGLNPKAKDSSNTIRAAETPRSSFLKIALKNMFVASQQVQDTPTSPSNQKALMSYRNRSRDLATAQTVFIAPSAKEVLQETILNLKITSKLANTEKETDKRLDRLTHRDNKNISHIQEICKVQKLSKLIHKHAEYEEAFQTRLHKEKQLNLIRHEADIQASSIVKQANTISDEFERIGKEAKIHSKSALPIILIKQDIQKLRGEESSLVSGKNIGHLKSTVLTEQSELPSIISNSSRRLKTEQSPLKNRQISLRRFDNSVNIKSGSKLI